MALLVRTILVLAVTLALLVPFIQGIPIDASPDQRGLRSPSKRSNLPTLPAEHPSAITKRGLAGSEARLLVLIERKSDVEADLQIIAETLAALGNSNPAASAALVQEYQAYAAELAAVMQEIADIQAAIANGI